MAAINEDETEHALPWPEVGSAGVPEKASAWVKTAGKDKAAADNPPSWVSDEATWERAKAAVEPHWDRYEEPWAVVAHVYQQMGGSIAASRTATRFAVHPRQVHAASPRHLDAPLDEAGTLRWMQLAEEGEWRGHPSGPFELDPTAFDQMIANLHAHPSYVAGEDGIGAKDVIPIDFHHASEQAPSVVAHTGAPAQGWIRELQKRKTADRAQLWGLAHLLEPARTFVAETRYKWTSIAAWKDAVDPKSGESIGWYISSVALTNDPFIQGMVPIAATRGGRIAMLAHAGHHAIVEQVGYALGLDSTEITTERVRAELDKLAAWIANPPADPPAGVDLRAPIESLRSWVLNLPTLTEDAAVIEEARRAVARAENALAQQTRGVQDPQQPATTAANRGTDMSLLKLLATRFNIPADEAAVEAAIQVALDKGGADSAMLSKLLGALGVANPEQALASLDQLRAASALLSQLMPELQALTNFQVSEEEKKVDEDVGMAMQAHRLPEAVRASLALDRRGGVQLPTQVAQEDFIKTLGLMRQRNEARSAFLQRYAVPVSQQHLLGSLAAHPQPGLGLLALAGYPAGTTAPAAPQDPLTARRGGAPAIDLSRFVGRNEHERMQQYVREQAGGDKLPFDLVWEKATRLLQEMRGQAA